MNRIVMFALLLLFWTLLTWPSDLQPQYLQEVAVGILVALGVTRVMGQRGRSDDGQTQTLARWLDPRRYFWALVYLFVLAAYIVKANVEVAYRVLHPSMPIKPGIVKVRTRLRNASSRAALSNSITLTPGTLTIDIEDDGTMMVHWIYVRSLDEVEATRQVLGRFEWFIERIFE